MEASQKSALAIAHYLEGHAEVVKVRDLGWKEMR
jgi:cystathionine beta-lyase/cystathionine gamma-synthase